MIYLYLIAFAFLLYCSVCFRVAVLHPFAVVGYFCKDTYKYFRYKQKRNLKTGELVAYVGLFGKGKTLSAVHLVVEKIYKKFNNLIIYDSFRKKWVTQRIYVLSNVDLAIPMVKFTGLNQLVELSREMKVYDEENDTKTCIIVLGDEFSVQMNSRSFKSNIDPLFLNTLLCCRHYSISIFYTSQRFSHVDALLRQVTSYVISCDKRWRFMVHEKYDAYALEKATDTTLVKPLKRFGWFIKDKDYANYDTLACVDNLSKKCKKGDMMSSAEILAAIGEQQVQMDAVTTPSRKFIKSSKRRMK